MNNNNMIRFRRYIIIIVCIGIIVIRFIYPKLSFDIISLILLGIALVALIIPELEKLFQRAKKIKLGSFELELIELNQETEKVEENIKEPNIKYPGSTEVYGLGFKITEDFSSDILKLSIEIEKITRSIFSIGIGEVQKRPLSVVQSISILESEGLIEKETSLLIRNFWNIRNKVVHGHDVELNRKEMLAFIDIGLRILRILKTVYLRISDGILNPE